MRKLFSDIWKKIKVLSFSRKWYILLIILSSTFVLHYRSEIYSFEETNAYNLIFLLWLLLLLLPLFSEFEFMGIKIKKEVEQATGEIKDSVQEIKQQIFTLQLSNSNSIDNRVYNNFVDPSILDNNNSKADEENTTYEKEDSSRTHTNSCDWNIDNNSPAVTLFKARLSLELELRRLYSKINNEVRQTSYRQIIAVLHKNEIIDSTTANQIQQILTITSRGVHGEIVSEEYITFVENTLPKILQKLSDSNKNFENTDKKPEWFVCPRCHYSGYSTLGNECPRCHFISDDY